MLISVSFGLSVPDPGGLLIPATEPRLQAKVVPAVRLVGVYEKRVLVQISGGFRGLLSLGEGFTITTTSNVDGLTQPLAVS